MRLVQIQVGLTSPLYDNTNVNAILNGLEIMKISSPAGILDKPYLFHGNSPMNSKGKNGKMGPIIGSIVGDFVALRLLATGYCMYIHPKLN